MTDNNEAGFTLLETLLTLMIASILILLPLLSIDRVIESVQIDLFFRELTSNLTLMQNHAILVGDRTVANFSPSENQIKFRVQDADRFSRHVLDSELYLEKGLYELHGKDYHTVEFLLDTGNVSIKKNDKWTTTFDTSKGQYQLVFQLGSGRFDVKKK